MGRAHQREIHQIKDLGLLNVGFRYALPNLHTTGIYQSIFLGKSGINLEVGNLPWVS